MEPFTLTSPAVMTIGGAAVDTATSLDVVNPATGRPFASVPAGDRTHVDAAFEAATRAFQTWREDEEYRRQSLRAMADVVQDAAGELTQVLTAEQGKPLSESQREFAGTAGWLRYYADLEVPPEVLRDDSEARVEVVRRPLGAVAAIAPFNFPVMIGFAKVATAFRAGSTVVLKPSPYTPLATLKLGELLGKVLPPGVLNVLSGGDEIGPMMTTHPLTRAVSFTGSTATGRKIATAAGDDLKRLTLELGGNDPVIVLDDVDVDAVVEQLFPQAFNNNGQVCVAPKRIYVAREIRSALVDAFADRARAVKVGDGFLPGTVLGPLNNAPQRDRVVTLVTEAVAHGAKVVTGGRAIDGTGYFYEPTILTDVSDGVRIVDEEQFGPALPIVEYTDIEDALRRANSGMFGLGGSVWSADTERAEAVARRLETGMSWVNTHTAISPAMPFGGAKWSGLGTEGGPRGLDGYSDFQVIYRSKNVPGSRV
ncbi:aldehyde dehydrogenase family protein [Streptomyces sp. NPDC058470]|uniref:aldehyde dehydrogenase family protein n=1 Tax=Streptomyces sp. NPDC058470 TaxID=3346515 RepID=UPI003660A607